MIVEMPFVEHNNETQHTREINMLQIELSIRKFKNLENKDDNFLEWTEKYSEKFRKIFDRELDNESDFWDKFKGVSWREDLMKKIEEELYIGEKEMQINEHEELKLAA